MGYFNIDIFKELVFCMLIALFAYTVLTKKDYLKKYKGLTAWNKVLIILFSFIFGIWYTRVFSSYALIRIADATIISFVVIIWLCFSKINVTPRKLKLKDITIISTVTVVLIALYFFSLEVTYGPDPRMQYECVVSGQYNNWHPAIHTFLFFTVPTLIFGQQKIVPIIAQFVFVIISFSYVNCSLYRIGVKKSLILLLLLLFLINKTLVYQFTYLGKDVPYSMAMLVLTVNVFEIYFSDGEWLDKTYNKIILIVVSMLVLTLRHNGILSYITIGLALMLVYKQKRKFLSISFLSILVLYFVVTGPIYNIIGVQSHPEIFAEKIGIPNNQICYIITKQGNVTDDQLEFINQCYDLETVFETYDVGDFNGVKWKADGAFYNGDFIESNKKEYLTTFIQIIKANPKMAVMAYYHTIKKMFEVTLIVSPIESIKWNEGFSMLISTIGLFVLFIKQKWKRMIPFIPIYFNFIGIMGVITGWELRFILPSTIGCIYLLVFSIMEPINNGIKYMKTEE